MIIGAIGPEHEDVAYSGDKTYLPLACVQDYVSWLLPREIIIMTALCAGLSTCPPALVCMVIVDPHLISIHSLSSLFPPDGSVQCRADNYNYEKMNPFKSKLQK